LGLVRVVLSANYLGGGVLASAWFYSFMIPNLFRRLLGEGALGSALLPIVSYAEVNSTKSEVRKKITVILSTLFLVLLTLCVALAILSLFISQYTDNEMYLLILKTVPVIIPYALLICMTGAITSALNSYNIYFLPALGAILLNIFLISAYYFVCPHFIGQPNDILRTLAISVVLAGITQLTLVVVLLIRLELFPHISEVFSKELWSNQFETLKELWRLTLPALLGAGALQLSMFIDKSLALMLGDAALPALTYSDRIVYLPIGVFAVSFGTVSLSHMSKSAAKGDEVELANTLTKALEYLLLICIPIAGFIIVFRKLIIATLFLHGEFDLNALDETSYAMFYYAMGIPAFASIKIVVSAFHSRKDMKTPVKISLICIIINLILNLSLMFYMKQAGLALATVISSLLNNLLLLRILRKELNIRFLPLIKLILVYSCITSVAVLLTSYLRNIVLLSYGNILVLMVCSGVFVLLYLIGLLCVYRERILDIKQFLKR
jgi:putative peptidoglycan lipid II flippase